MDAKEYMYLATKHSPKGVSLSSTTGKQIARHMAERFPLVEVAAAWGFAPGRYLTLLQALRTSGITQSYLAAFLGVTSAAVCQWATGQKKPAEKHRVQVRELFGDCLSFPFEPLADQYIHQKGDWADFQEWQKSSGQA